MIIQNRGVRLLIAAMFLAPDLANAQTSAGGAKSVASGHNLALMICSVCHVVGPDQTEPPKLAAMQRTPSFEEIANDPKTTPRSLRSFITTTHWDEKTHPMTMPNPMLVDYEIDDVIAYLMSLRVCR